MIYQQAISLTVAPLKVQQTGVMLLPIVRAYYNQRRLVHRGDAVYAQSLIFGGESVSGDPSQRQTIIDMTVVVQSPSDALYDQFMKSFFAKDRDMPFRLVSHTYQGV